MSPEAAEATDLRSPGPPDGEYGEGERGGATARRGLTFRSVLIGAAWMFIVAVLIPYNDYYLQSTFITGNLLPLGAVLILAAMVLLMNLLWQLRLMGTETMLLFIVAAGLAAVGLVFDEPGLQWQAYLPLVAAAACMLARGAVRILQALGARDGEDAEAADPAGAGGVGEFTTAGVLFTAAVGSFIAVGAHESAGWPVAPAIILILTAWPLAGALRGRGSPALDGRELIIVWILMIVGSGVPSSGLVRYMYPHMVAPIYLATPENAWETKLHPYLPDDLVPAKPPRKPAEDAPPEDLRRYEAEKAHYERVVEKAYEGFRSSELESFEHYEKDENGLWVKKTTKDASLWQAIPWRAWLKPTAIWLAFVVLCYYMMICISVILRRQWEDRERLNFPLTQLPVEMIAPPRPGRLINEFFRSKAMWIGFAIPVVVHLVNGLNKFNSNVPYIDTTIWVWRFFREKPWNAMTWGNMSIYFTVIGFTYLLPMEVAFSLWFWYFFSQMVLLLGGYFEFTIAGKPWKWTMPTYQQMGAYLAYFCLLMWAARRHLATVIRRAFGRKVPDAESDRDEAMSYVQAFWGLVGATIVISGAARHYLDIPFFHTVLCLGLMMLTLVVVSRIVSQGGVIFVLHSWRPLTAFNTFFGGSVFGMGSASAVDAHAGRTTFTVFKYVEGFFLHDLRETSMPNMMNAFKLGGVSRISLRKVLGLIALSIGLAILVASVARIYLMYKHGGLDLRPYSFRTRPGWDFKYVVSSIKTPPKFEWGHLIATGWGAGFITLVTFLSLRFYWWPLHPIGILLFPSYSIQCFWWSFFLGWLCKVLVVKYGGGRTFKRLRPGFLGLILGDCFVGAVWIIVGMVMQERVISILPG